MSRFTSSPFHKPSPFQFPHALPSPPETQVESITMAPAYPSATSGLHDHGINESVLGTSSPDQGSRIRKSSIAYNTSSLRETKDRSAQRPVKPLVIVIPPPSLIPNYAQASAAISLGPPNRVLQGTIMPLLPSMFAQLTAIAKEFNFPSTTGLCLYMHYVEDGIAITPRISEESWHSLWTHFSEPALLPHERKALVAGKIEFDIDLRHARWYTAWISNVLREVPDPLSHHLASAAPSLAHFRGESKTTFTEGRHLDDDIPETSSPRPLPNASTSRHVPKKLSLVERFDSTKSEGKLQAPAVESSNAQVLSPIVQEDEPQSARNDLDNRVNSWRASALSSTHKLSAKGQPVLDPPNLPNDIPIQSPSLPVEEEGVELNLADYAWSISSRGPLSCEELSPLSWDRVSSVDIAHRLVGSVCSTPSVCTSFGPADYEMLASPVSWGRVSSVRLGDRLAGSVATTPSICTSFGPVDYNPLSPLESSSRILSPDIAHRFFESAPPTPFTATSWGAPSSYPPSPAFFSPTYSVGLAERVFVEGHVLERYSLADEEEEGEGEIKLFNPWPFTDRFPRAANEDWDESSLDLPYSEEPISRSEHHVSVWRHAWPYTAVRTPSPVHEEDAPSVRGSPDLVAKEVDSPVQPWGHAWPYNATPQLENEQVPSPTQTQQRDAPWGHAWPYNKTSMAQRDQHKHLALSRTSVSMKPEKVRPWGHSWPYNAFSSNTSQHETVVPSSLTFGYPYMRIYAPVYPDLEIYPPQVKVTESVKKERFTLPVDLPSCYPNLEIYKPAYPYNLESIYPSVKLRHQPTRPELVDYPYFELYPAVTGPRYAYLCSVMRMSRTTYPDLEIYPAVQGELLKKCVSQSLSTQPPTNYPVINLYPSVYPYFDLYPSVNLGYERDASRTTKTKPTVEKIGLHIYPPVHQAVYPNFDLYPAMMAPFWLTEESQTLTTQPAHHLYPYFDLYPSVYPHFNIYPAVAANMNSPTHTSNLVPTAAGTSQAVYPYFDLYPAVYPHLNLYPSTSAATCKYFSKVQTNTVSPHPQAIYPVFNLYPAVYPHLDLYLPLPRPFPPSEKPNRVEDVKHAQGICTARATSRLTHSELHAIVMMERVGSSRGFHAPQLSLDEGHTSPISPQLSRSPSGLRSARISHLPGSPRELRGPSMAFSGSSSLVNNILSPVEQTTPLRKSLSLKHRESPRLIPDVPILKPTPQRRESLVSQRVKAYAANMDSVAFRETVSRFPMPPTPPSRGFPPLPRVPADR